jgi:ABC-type phosphate transport system substrate-binding protein
MRATPGIAWILVALTASGGPARAEAEPEIVAVVSATSEIPKLTADEVADIFLGKLTRLAGGVRPVPLDQPESSAARAQFYQQFAGKSAAQVKAHWSKVIFTGRGQPPAQVPDSREARRRVAEDPNAIAYIERDLVDESVRIVTP